MLKAHLESDGSNTSQKSWDRSNKIELINYKMNSQRPLEPMELETCTSGKAPSMLKGINRF